MESLSPERFHCVYKSLHIIRCIQTVEQAVRNAAVSYTHLDVYKRQVGDPVFVETTFMVKPWNMENIRMRRETFGGCTYDQGCYNFSLILALLGEEPDEIQASAHCMENGVDDFSSVYFHFPSGANASAVSGMCCGQRADRYFIHGTKGTLEAPLPYNAKGKLCYYIHRDGQTLSLIHI